MAIDQSGQLWVWTTKGVRKVRDGELWPAVREGESVVGGPEFNVDRWTVTRKEGFLLGGKSGLFDIANLWPRRLAGQRDGEIWSIGGGRPISVFKEGRTWEFYANPLVDQPDVTAVHADREGNIWVGFDGNGLVRLRPKQVRTYSKDQGLPSNNTVTIAQDAAYTSFFRSNSHLVQ